MEDSPSGMDPAGLAEAPELVGAVSQAMEGLAAQIQSRDGKWVLRSWPRKLVGPELELLRVYMLRIWFISAGAEPQRAGDKALALQAREATYFIDDLQDLILHCCTLARRAKIFSLPAVWFCWNRMLGLIAPKPPRKIVKDIKVVNTETRRIGNLLQKVADPSATSMPMPPPDSGRETVQPKAVLVTWTSDQTNSLTSRFLPGATGDDGGQPPCPPPCYASRKQITSATMKMTMRLHSRRSGGRRRAVVAEEDDGGKSSTSSVAVVARSGVSARQRRMKAGGAGGGAPSPLDKEWRTKQYISPLDKEWRTKPYARRHDAVAMGDVRDSASPCPWSWRCALRRRGAVPADRHEL